MKLVLQIILLMSLLWLLVKCDGDEVTSRNYPRIKTLPVTEINSEGARFRAEIIFRGNFEIIEYGFVWGQSQNPTKENSDRVIYSENIQSTNFSKTIETTLKEGNSYFVRAFVETNNFTVYGENVAFTSLGSGAPSVSLLNPQNGYRGDTIEIIGSHFSYIKNDVSFNDVKAEVILNSDTSLFVIVPDCVTKEEIEISVSVTGNKSISPQKFNLHFPRILDFTPKSGNNSDIIEIYGQGFQPDKVEIYFGFAVQATIVESTHSYLKVQLPPNIPESGINYIRYSNGCQEIASTDKFTLEGVLISNVSIDEAIIAQDLVTLNGSGFSNTAENNIIVINDNRYEEVEFVESSDNQISFYLPGNTPVGEIQLTVSVLDKTFNESIAIDAISPWIRKSNLPGRSFGSYGSTFVIDNKIYFANSTGTDDKDFWQYDPITDGWTQKADIPGPPYTLRMAFAIGNKGYIGTGDCVAYYCVTGRSTSSAILSYDPSSDAWSELSYIIPDPFEVNYGAFGAIGFSVNDTGYMFGGYVNWSSVKHDAYWKYDYSIDKWSVINEFSEFKNFNFLLNPTGFVMNGKIYLGLGQTSWGDNINYEYSSNFWEYDPNLDTWRKISDFPGTPRAGAVGFTKNGKGYVGLGYNSTHGAQKDFWAYDPVNDTWRRIADLPASPRQGAVSAEVNNRVFVGFGNPENDLWEFE